MRVLLVALSAFVTLVLAAVYVSSGLQAALITAALLAFLAVIIAFIRWQEL